ncbi:hypothetical protein TSUD_210770 [Trifolium subterraneum]|uniref:Uncharacterized protein n=1 Tax=Trifolium subterraneum TaxID=3900 RepID=A0A2Z6N534_TRISU|nr:hypothetical protein TSUD_210770 [Trifolium subterraneum]
MAEQTEKAFLKQPKVFLSSKKSGKGKRRQEKVEIAFGNPLVLDLRLPVMPLKEPILTTSAHSLAMFPSGVIS